MRNKKSNNLPTQPVLNSMCVVFFFDASSDSQHSTLFFFALSSSIDWLLRAYVGPGEYTNETIDVVVGACLT